MKSKLLKVSLMLLAVTLVYVVGFSMQHDGGHEECPVAAVAGGQCSLGTSGVSFLDAANLHLNALKRISLGALSYLWFAMFAAVAGLYAILPERVLEKLKNSPGARRIRLEIKTSSLKKSLDWLTTREKRDPSAILAVGA